MNDSTGSLGLDVLAGRRGHLASLLTGALLPFAFAPFGVFPLAVACLAVLFSSWIGTTPRQALLRGWLFGVGSFGVGVFWIHESFQFSHVALPVALLSTGALVAGLALYPALTGYAVRRWLAGGQRVWLMLTVPAAWTFGEWFRGWFLTGFTWLQVGYSQIDAPLKGLFAVLGSFGVSWAIALSAGVVAFVVHADWRRRSPWLVAMVALWAAGAVLGRIDWTEPAGQPVRVALVQGNIEQQDKWRPQMRGPTLQRYLRLTRDNWDADLVIWPETALPGLYHNLHDFVRQLAEEALANDTDVVFGVPVLEPRERRYYNSVFVVGERSGVYHKRHLVPFGEYLPFDRWLRPVTEWLGIPVSEFSAGPTNQLPPLAAGHELGISVCYEVAFGREILRAVPEATLLVTVSNDAWFGDSVGPHQHFEMARARAAETGRFLLRATNTGITAIVGPDGGVVARMPQFEIGVVTGEAVPRKGATPYVRSGDLPVALALAVVLIGVLVRARRRRATQP